MNNKQSEVWEIDLPKGAVKIKSNKEIVFGCRLFYELGHKIIVGKQYNRTDWGSQWSNVYGDWVREGKFKEIMDVKRFKNSDRMNDKSYIEHHNFHILHPK